MIMDTYIYVYRRYMFPVPAPPFIVAQICLGMCLDVDPTFTHFGTEFSSEVSTYPTCIYEHTIYY